MSKYPSIYALLLIILSSCNINKDTTKKIWHSYFNVNGDSTIYYTINGVKQGKSISYFKSGKVKKEFFYKDNLLDSTFTEYWNNGNPKHVLYFIGGKENGYKFDYSEKVKSGIKEEAFYDNGEIKIVGLLNKPNNSTYKYDYFINYSPDSLVHIGSIVGNENGIIKDSSSYYRIESETVNDIPSFSSKSDVNILFRFYRVFSESNVGIILKHSTSLDSNSYSTVSNEKINVDGSYSYRLGNKSKGWHYLRGYFTESIVHKEMGVMKRKVPIYFNFYVY